MKKFLCGVFFIFIGNILLAQNSVDTATIFLEKSNPIIDWGTVDAGETIEYVFTFKNPFKQVILVEKIVSDDGKCLSFPANGSKSIRKPVKPNEIYSFRLKLPTNERCGIVRRNIAITYRKSGLSRTTVSFSFGGRVLSR